MCLCIFCCVHLKRCIWTLKTEPQEKRADAVNEHPLCCSSLLRDFPGRFCHELWQIFFIYIFCRTKYVFLFVELCFYVLFILFLFWVLVGCTAALNWELMCQRENMIEFALLANMKYYSVFHTHFCKCKCFHWKCKNTFEFKMLIWVFWQRFNTSVVCILLCSAPPVVYCWIVQGPEWAYKLPNYDRLCHLLWFRRMVSSFTCLGLCWGLCGLSSGVDGLK